MPIVLNLFLTLSLAGVLTLLGPIFSFKLKVDREKLSPFECGFTPKSFARLPFSLRFFLITIIFLIFDVELILIFPLVPALHACASIMSLTSLVGIVLILFVGLLHEIFQGSLSWAN